MCQNPKKYIHTTATTISKVPTFLEKTSSNGDLQEYTDISKIHARVYLIYLL